MIKHLRFIVITLLLVNGCASQTGRYKHANDSTPTRIPTQAEMQDATPRIEQPSRGGNRDYEVRNKRYHVLKTAESFSETGIASWYGKKFHGHLTSNGEIYDMYGMSAAHKNLPLPTYLKVTNLSNKKSVIVRVNDRGPFHQKRIIDLSYSAAYKIGLLKTGTAKVKITAITASNINNLEEINYPEEENKPQIDTLSSKKQQAQYYIQVFATKNEILAKSTAQALTAMYNKKVIYPELEGIYRIQMGPLPSEKVAKLLIKLKANGYPNAFKRQK